MGCLVPRRIWLRLLLAWHGSLAFSALPREFSASGDVITRADVSNNDYSTYGSQFAVMQSLEDSRRLQQVRMVYELVYPCDTPTKTIITSSYNKDRVWVSTWAFFGDVGTQYEFGCLLYCM